MLFLIDYENVGNAGMKGCSYVGIGVIVSSEGGISEQFTFIRKEERTGNLS